MRSSIPIVAALAAGVLGSAGLASAQIQYQPSVSGPIALDEGDADTAFGEVAIIANPLNSNQAAVMWNRYDFNGEAGQWQDGIANYEVTLKGFAVLVITPPAFRLTGPSALGVQDPGVAASPLTGDLFISGSSDQEIQVDHFPSGSGQPDWGSVARAVRNQSGTTPPWGDRPKDKPFIVAGRWPDPANHPTGSYVVCAGYTAFNGIDESLQGLRFCHSLDSGASGQTWRVPGDDSTLTGFPRIVDATDGTGGPIQSKGFGAFPVMLASGRVAMGWMGSYGDPALDTAYMSYTDTLADTQVNGRFWQAEQQLNFYGPVPSTQLYGVPPHLPNTVLLIPELSVSTDPNNGTNPATNVVMTAFAGVDESNLGSSNTDIVIARSITGGAPDFSQTPPGPAFPPIDTIRITDDLLHASGVHLPNETAPYSNTAEYHPSLVIDDQGGINLMVCQATSELPTIPPHNMKNYIWYLRWPSFESLRSGAHPFAANLTPDGVDSWPFFGPKFAGNDYVMMCRAGCGKLYLGYSRPDPATSYWTVYVRIVTLPGPCPIADVDGNSLVDINDASMFINTLGTSDPLADRNQDGRVDALDAVIFFDAYAASHP